MNYSFGSERRNKSKDKKRDKKKHPYQHGGNKRAMGSSAEGKSKQRGKSK